VTDDDPLRAAADVIATADALLVGAGAGMGVDSGLPDFRGTTGFWRAYPVYEKLGLDFASMANPRWFERDPSFAWGFYGHRLELYRRTVPHEGFVILQRWAKRMAHGAFAFTSNVDGQFQKAGFDEARVIEIHGSIHFVQCTRCETVVASAEPQVVEVDATTLRARDPLPRCDACGAVRRPNILMFGDDGWDAGRTEEQEHRLEAWLAGLGDGRLAVVECGAGTAIPSVRAFCERASRRTGASLVRINIREHAVPRGSLGLALGALEALRRIDAHLGAR
jgi:NAD-dependent SIR2 family protein deacetylase